MMQITEQIRDFIATNYFVPSDTRLEAIDSFLARGILDSTGVLELVSFVETSFGVSIDDHELVPSNFDSLHAVAAFVERKVRETS
jgi:acyl carrier protein